MEDNKLELWFGLSYSGWLAIPRCTTKQMPLEWQNKMAALLEEYDEAFPNPPNIETMIVIKQNGKFTKEFNWLHRYRRPDMRMIKRLKDSSFKWN